MKFKVKGYIACWEQPEILGSGSQEYGWEYPKTEAEALDLCRKTHRNSLQRTVFLPGEQRTVTHYYNFMAQRWEDGSGRPIKEEPEWQQS